MVLILSFCADLQLFAMFVAKALFTDLVVGIPFLSLCTKLCKSLLFHSESDYFLHFKNMVLLFFLSPGVSAVLSCEKTDTDGSHPELK